MAEKKYGIKRVCSNCETKFYDFNKKSHLTCPHCKSEMNIEEDFVYAQPSAQIMQARKSEVKDEFHGIDNTDDTDDNDNDAEMISLDDASIEEEQKN